MRQATIDVVNRSVGGIDLTTKAGCEQALELAINRRDRELFNQILGYTQQMEARGWKRGDSTPARSGSPLAAEMRRLSAQCRALAAAADQNKLRHALAWMAGDTGRRATPQPTSQYELELDLERAVDGFTEDDDFGR